MLLFCFFLLIFVALGSLIISFSFNGIWVPYFLRLHLKRPSLNCEKKIEKITFTTNISFKNLYCTVSTQVQLSACLNIQPETWLSLLKVIQPIQIISIKMLKKKKKETNHSSRSY